MGDKPIQATKSQWEIWGGRMGTYHGKRIVINTSFSYDDDDDDDGDDDDHSDDDDDDDSDDDEQ